MPPSLDPLVALLRQIDEMQERQHLFREEIREQLKTWQTEVTGAIIEYKRTVNSALNLLATEMFASQKTAKERFEKDDADRAARQQQVDKRDRVLIGTAGCLIVVSIVSTLVIVGVVVWMLTR